MAALEHIPQQGTLLYYSTDNSAFTELTDPTSVEPPSMERDSSPDTVLSATVEVSTPGVLLKITQGKFTLFLHKTLYASLKTLQTNKTNPVYWRVKYPALSTESTSGSKIEWQGWIKKITPGKADVGADKLMCDYEIERTTDPVLTAGS